MKQTKHTRILALIMCVFMMMSVASVLASAETTPEYYVWDFSAGSATNTYGSSTDNTLSLVKTSISNVDAVEDILVDGILKSSKLTTMKLSKPVTLSSENNWTMEVVAKGDGENAIRTFFSTGEKISSSTYFYISSTGDLCVVKNIGFTADDGTAVSKNYTYYKVSDEDFNNSVLASGEFVSTEYHTYQLRCINGVFQYWLDGEKIGDLALSEQASTRNTGKPQYTQGTGTPANFSTLKISYVGCGSNSNSASQGIQAEVKKLAIYTDCHVYDGEVKSDEYLAFAADCQGPAAYYKSCSICGESSKGTQFEDTFFDTDTATYNAYHYTWDFSKESATSTNGLNALTFVRGDGKDTGVVLKNGVLASDRNIYKMSRAVKLSASNGWTAEIVIAGVEGTAIRGVFSTAAGYGSASFIYINAYGDLFIGKKGAFTADDGTSVASGYTYYKVSDEDFATNMPADFDITEEHKYELRCVNGVFQYWLDGVKIGNLSLSEQSTGRGTAAKHYTQGNGTPFDFSNMTMGYVGCGASDNANYGLTGSVSYLGIYPNNYSYETEVVAPECENDGYTINSCISCDHTYIDSVVPATGHTIVDGDCANCDAVLTLEQQLSGTGTVVIPEEGVDLEDEVLVIEGNVNVVLNGDIRAAGVVVVDNRTRFEGTGKLVIGLGQIAISGETDNMPVWVGDGYVFNEVVDQSKSSVTGETSFNVVFRPSFGNTDYNQTILGGETDAGLTFEVQIWNGETKVFAGDVSDALVKEAYANGGAISLSVKGATNGATYTVKLVIKSDIGLYNTASIATVTVNYTTGN